MRLYVLLRFQEFWRSLPLFVKIIQAVAVALFFWGSMRPAPTELRSAPEGKRDVELYQAIVQQVRQGENYYRAAGRELHARQYATIPAFNWRLPTLAVFLSVLRSDQIAGNILFTVGFASVVLWCFYLTSTKHEVICLLAVPLLSVTLPLGAGSTFTFHELWAGQLISLSLALRLLGFVAPSVIVGAAALSIRELALPFVLLMAAVAWHERKIREAWAWGIVAGLFGLAWSVHLHVARSLTPPDALTNSWLATGGWSQVLQTTRMNFALTDLPLPLRAGVVSLTLAGVWVWRSCGSERVALVVTAYLAAFAVVGRPDNIYWGFMIAPILLLGIVGWAAALHSAFRRTTHDIAAVARRRGSLLQGTARRSDAVSIGTTHSVSPR